ncbi:hypothetical protein COT97_02200 [Candidatus Falkowbacteria bacterium CG10_big_fil_rev_8_21_14_0_10_39_11]|uniref:Band 7 domain-containing protein n=1 Tax=Candidatus Falkowbacteria bacterium CG10_big_fil_rev_8_21_14_0_10_39_11 TaxID=1974565 RepID=A0A2H0V5E6_9BACT|nr:MAG: hypothetical protein COT97_02200 [Candidatus Falkowbacteria bacterium CG10_big_fil_rev_8_21_14_0_10_39_11]
MEWYNIAGIICLVLLAAVPFITIIKQPTMIFTLRLGKLDRILLPGLNWRIPLIDDLNTFRFSTKIFKKDGDDKKITESIITSDGRIVTVEIGLVTQIGRSKNVCRNGNPFNPNSDDADYAERFINSQDDLDKIVREIIIDIVRSAINGYEFDDTQTHKQLVLQFLRFYVKTLANEEVDNSDPAHINEIKAYEDQRLQQALDGLDPVTDERRIKLITRLFNVTRIDHAKLVANHSILETTGLHIVRVNIDDISPPDKIVDAYQAIETAHAQSLAAKETAKRDITIAKGEAKSIDIKATAEASRRLKMLEAEAAGQNSIEEVRTAHLRARTKDGIGDLANAAIEFAGAFADRARNGGGSSNKKDKS